MPTRGRSSAPATAVVLGLGVGGLGVARALGRAGISTLGLWSAPGEVGRFSRHCRPVRAPAVPGDETLSVLRTALGRCADKPILLPTTDAYAEWINERQHALRELFRFHTVERSSFERLISKLSSTELAREHGLEAPRTSRFEDLMSFQRGIGDFRFPVLVKPIDTFRHSLPNSVKNAMFETRRALADYVRAWRTRLSEMVFQEVVPSGDGHIHVCTVLCGSGGEPLLVYTGRKLRQYLPDYGVTCFGVSERSEVLEILATRFLRAIGYQGLCTLEFARDRRDGQFVFLEANLRAYYSNQLFTDAGLNFPLAEYRLLATGQRPTPVAQKDGVLWIDLPRDLASFYRRRDPLAARDWLRSVLQARSFATFALDDPFPWLSETGRLAKGLWGFATGHAAVSSYKSQ